MPNQAPQVVQNGQRIDIAQTRNNFSNALNDILSDESTDKLIRKSLQEHTGEFVTSLVELVKNDANLAACDPRETMKAALIAVGLRLPVSKTLGQAYIIPYKNQPQFQIGYRGLYQIARRSHTLVEANAEVVYEGQTVTQDYITGKVVITGTPDYKKRTPIGYVAYIKESDGFEKVIYWTLDKMVQHAKTYSKAIKLSAEDLKKAAIDQSRRNKCGGIGWENNFEAMALKTIFKSILSRWATIDPFSEMQRVMDSEPADISRDEEIASNANVEDIEAEEVKPSTEAPVNACPV